MLELLLKSVLVGMAIAAPVGPIGALCINRSLTRGFVSGVAGGLGTALADASYGALAALGFAAFSAALAKISTPLALFGGAFLIFLGWREMRKTGAASVQETAGRGDLIRTLLTTYVLTITNPATILSFVAIFAGFGLADASGNQALVVVVLGVFAGSLLWWVFLSGLVAIIRHRLPVEFAHWVARISGGILIGFGLVAVSSAFA
ncbi:LysE family translocator [Martelella mediterranea]|uniref:Putative LysE/RhtB family amino acid efflux pump n=1 Tax=Martelella mediterranea TaxID=293089 RepID=A0A4R3NUA4_9HYPH|nr:LysE family transporter [Martelella mediterranea]TCT40878.1 putative LysE/RhtB family amino acid efflux pump [Martelella mediterranea]